MSYKNKKHNVKESIEEYTKVKNKTTSHTRKKNSKNNSSKEISKTSFNTIEVIIIMVITILFGILIGYFICYIRNDSKQDFSKDEINEFIELYDDVLDEYYKDIDSEDLIEYAIKGMIDNLDDQYSEYINKEDVDLYEEKLKGSFVGIGVEIMYVENGSPIITKVYDDSPAKESGIINGDILYKVENKELLGLSMEEISNLIKKGKNGETIKITILRNNEEKEFEIERKIVELESVSIDYIDSNNNKIGIIAINNFAQNTYLQFKKIYKEAVDNNIDSLIIDVRNNSGGYLSSAKNIAELFLDKGNTIYLKDNDGSIERIISTSDKEIQINVILLINNGTASASEVFVAALQDNLNIVTVGTNTYGKGTIQKLKKLSSGAYVKFTVQTWLTPNGNQVDGIGITPTFYIEQSELFYNNPTKENDVQLAKAIELLNKGDWFING